MIQIDMKMPSSCYDCPFVKNERTNDYGSFCECGIIEDYETINLLEHSKHPNCPLIEEESCGDCINRQAVLDEMYKRKADGDAITVGFIKNLPPVNPQPKTAHWILHPKGIYTHLICDNCLSNAPYDCRTNYCPNCGYRMVDPQESETWNGIHAQITAPKGTFERIFNDADDENDI